MAADKTIEGMAKSVDKKARLDNVVTQLNEGVMKFVDFTLETDMRKVRWYTSEDLLRARIHYWPFYTLVSIAESQEGKFAVTVVPNILRQIGLEEKAMDRIVALARKVFSENGIDAEKLEFYRMDFINYIKENGGKRPEPLYPNDPKVERLSWILR